MEQEKQVRLQEQQLILQHRRGVFLLSLPRWSITVSKDQAGIPLLPLPHEHPCLYGLSLGGICPDVWGFAFIFNMFSTHV